MATTIHSLSYKIDAQTAGFTRGLAASRKELSSAKRIMKQTEAPLEKYQREVREADTLLRKGAISQATYNRHVSQLRSNLSRTTPAFSKFSSSLKVMQGGVTGIASALGPAGIAVAGFAAALGGAAMKAGRITFQKITENMEKLDRIGKLSAKLAIQPQDLRGLQFAAATISGIEFEQTATAIQRMTRRISEAAAGTGEAQNAIKELGLDAKALNLAGPAEAFRRIADAIRKVETPADQLRIAFKLFDTEGAGLVTTLRAGRDGIDDLTGQFDKFNGRLSKLDISRIETLNDQLALTKLATEGLFEQLTAEISIPALGVIKELNAQIAGRDSSQQGVRGTLGLTAATVAQNATGVFARQAAGGAGGARGQIAQGLVDILLRRLPAVNDLAVKAVEDTNSQSIRNTTAIVSALERVEVAAKSSSVTEASVPGSR